MLVPDTFIKKGIPTIILTNPLISNKTIGEKEVHVFVVRRKKPLQGLEYLWDVWNSLEGVRKSRI